MGAILPIGRRVPLLAPLGLCGLLLASCARETGPPPPPVPADLADFDAEIAGQIRDRVDELRRAPGDPAGWRELGMLYHAHDQLDLAAECYRRGLALAPEAARTRFYLALVEQRLGRRAEAIADMRRVREIEPAYAPARWRLGLWLFEEGDAATARQVLEAARRAAPEDPAALHALARAHLQAEAAGEAAALLEGWLEAHPSDRYARFLLGTAYRRLGRADEAQSQLALGQGAQPSWSDPWSAEIEDRRAGFSARLAEATGLLDSDPRQAVERLERLRRQRPENTTVWINLGIGYRRQARLDDSVEALLEAVRLEPARGLGHFHLALTYAELSRAAVDRRAGADLMAKALQQAERAVELQPTSSRSHAMHGELLAQAGRPVAAVEAFRRAARDPQDPAWLHRLGGLLCQLERWDEAVPVLERYVERAGEDADGLLLLGVAQANTGDLEGAGASLERALRARPGDPRARQALDQLEIRRRGTRGPG